MEEQNKSAYQMFLENCEKREKRFQEYVENVNNINNEFDESGKMDFDKFVKWRKKMREAMNGGKAKKHNRTLWS